VSEVNDIPIDVLRHSAAHLLAHAVLDLYPETRTGIGPAVETGFYYDFLRETPFTPEDLEKIEKRMKEIARENTPIERLVLSKDEASACSREEAGPQGRAIRQRRHRHGLLRLSPTSPGPMSPRPAFSRTSSCSRSQY
jgi:Ser-tRNA(Ala) deacylase AlaX